MNPYKILDVEKEATKQNIMRAVTVAMRKREHSSRDIALAQKKLMDNISRGAEEFICFIDVKPFLEQLELMLPETKAQLLPEKEVSEADLEYVMRDA